MFNPLFTWKSAILFTILIILALYFYFAYKKETEANKAGQNLYTASFILSILVSRLILEFYRHGNEVFLILCSLFYFTLFFSNILKLKFISGYAIGAVTLIFITISAIGIFRTGFSLIRYARGVNYEKNNEFASAIKEYNSAFNYNPLLTPAKFRTAGIHMINNNLAEASREYNFLITEALDTSPHFFLGQIYERSRDNESALKEYSRVNKKSKFFKNSQARMAQLFIEQKDWTKALSCLNYIKDEISLRPLKFANPQDSLDFANLLYANNDPGTAVYFFINAIKLRKDKEEIPPSFYYNLAKAYYDLGNLSEAKVFFEKAKLAGLAIEGGSEKKEFFVNHIFEAEDLSHHCGRLVKDSFASGQAAWQADEKNDRQASFMAFGPGVPMPFGEYKAYFRLKSDAYSSKNSNAQICGIDVVGYNENNIFLYLASMPLRSSDFSGSSYKDFELKFHNPGDVFLQCRIQFVGGNIRADRIVIAPDIND